MPRPNAPAPAARHLPEGEQIAIPSGSWLIRARAESAGQWLVTRAQGTRRVRYGMPAAGGLMEFDVFTDTALTLSVEGGDAWVEIEAI
jgi:hypothetical protein